MTISIIANRPDDVGRGHYFSFVAMARVLLIGPLTMAGERPPGAAPRLRSEGTCGIGGGRRSRARGLSAAAWPALDPGRQRRPRGLSRRPAYKTYSTHDSMDTQARVCKALMPATTAGLAGPRRPAVHRQ